MAALNQAISMDPLSTASGIGSLCGTAVKLIVNLSEFVDSVQQAPIEVQALSNELASLYAGFGHIRVAVQAPRVSSFPERWKDDFDILMNDCEDTLKQVQGLVDKAKITEISGTTEQVWKSNKFAFKAKQVLVVNRRITTQNGILLSLLAALNKAQGAHVEERPEDIDDKVNELMATRANVREVLIVLDSSDEGSQEAEFVLSDQRNGQDSQPQGDHDNKDSNISEEKRPRE